MQRDRRCRQRSGARQWHYPHNFLSNRRPWTGWHCPQHGAPHRRVGIASPEHEHRPVHHRAQRRPSRRRIRRPGRAHPPWSGRRLNCGAGGTLIPAVCERLTRRRSDQTGACGRTVRMPPCPWICQATTMRRTAGIENKIASRVARGLFHGDRRPP